MVEPYQACPTAGLEPSALPSVSGRPTCESQLLRNDKDATPCLTLACIRSSASRFSSRIQNNFHGWGQDRKGARPQDSPKLLLAYPILHWVTMVLALVVLQLQRLNSGILCSHGSLEQVRFHPLAQL